MEKKLSYCELGLIPERYDSETDTYHDAQEYVNVAILTRPVNQELISNAPSLLIPLTVFCKPDIDACKKHLPKKPIDIRFGRVKLDPQGPYVTQCFDRETKQKLSNMIREVMESPDINRSHRDYEGNDAVDACFLASLGRGGWNRSPNITLVVGKTESGNLHFKTLGEKVAFGEQFKSLVISPILPDIPFRCRKALLTVIWTLPTGDRAFEKHEIEFA